MDSTASVFEEHRPFLRSLGYRMLGTLADADDVVQETWLRWSAAAQEEVRNPRSFLAQIATRLCLDHLKSARVRREKYIGEWLPEPLPDTLWEEPTANRGDVSFAVLHAMERLTPHERAAFLLHDVFGESFDQIAAFLSRSAIACRQLASRARAHLQEKAPRFPVDPLEGDRISAAFLQAAQTGDLNRLKTLLLPNAILISDGGAKVKAARRPILGQDRIGRMFAGIYPRKNPPDEVRPVHLNGLSGLACFTAGQPTDVLLFEIAEGRIRTLFVMRNPDKTRNLG